MSDELRAELEGKKTALNAATSPEVRTRLLMDCARLHEQLGDFPAMGRMAFEAAKLSPESLEATQLTRRAFVQARKWVAVMPWFQSDLR